MAEKNNIVSGTVGIVGGAMVLGGIIAYTATTATAVAVAAMTTGAVVVGVSAALNINHEIKELRPKKVVKRHASEKQMSKSKHLEKELERRANKPHEISR